MMPAEHNQTKTMKDRVSRYQHISNDITQRLLITSYVKSVICLKHYGT